MSIRYILFILTSFIKANKIAMRLSIFFQEPLQLINNVKELLALQTDAHNRQPFQAQESLNKSSNDQLARMKVQETICNNHSLEDEDYDHLNYTRTVNELSPNYIKLNNEK